tara:strand:- start:287 stop:439 length:153 start_codon:yes stop_codon:yes gene_type:complete
MLTYYEKQSKISHEKYTAAANIGEDDIAKKELANYQNYQELIKQQNGASK